MDDIELFSYGIDGRQTEMARCQVGFFLLLFTLGSGTAFSLSIVVTYADGRVQTKTSTGWQDVDAGDSLVLESVLRLGDQTQVEIQTPSGKIFLNRPGDFSLKDLVSNRQRIETPGAMKALQGKLATLLGGNSATNQTTNMGVRGADKSGSDTDFVDSDAQVAVQEARDQIASGNYSKAAARLAEARDVAETQQLPEILFTLAYAQVLGGEERLAANSLAGLDPTGTTWEKDYYLLKARLLLGSQAWDDVIALMTGPGSMVAADTNRAPEAWFVLALAYAGRGDGRQAKELFVRVSQAEAESDLGRSAREASAALN